jgi:hypothetical protein
VVRLKGKIGAIKQSRKPFDAMSGSAVMDHDAYASVFWPIYLKIK